MKIVVAPDSFKGSISAVRACEMMKAGIKEVFPEAEVVSLPVADGGEGTVDSFVAATSCRRVTVQVSDPLGRKIDAAFALMNDHTAVIEMAAASGLPLLEADERDPRKTTTYGTGELMRAALDLGCKRIILGIGGSATNDGGMGMAQALGFSFKDERGAELGFGGGELGRLCTIDCTNGDQRLRSCEIVAACDVSNPLCGKNGASHVFGPQKGADERMVEILDANLHHYADIIEEQLGISILNVPGTGAAGGLPAGLIAFCNATIQSGIEIVLDALDFEKHLRVADLVITGEGKIDSQSVFGKVPVGVARRAKQYNIPVIAVVGAIGDGAESVYEYGIDSIISIVDKPMALNDAIENVEDLLKKSVSRTMRIMRAAFSIAKGNGTL